MADTTEYEPLPDEFKAELLKLGMNEKQAETCGIIGQKVKNFAVECIADAEGKVYTSDLAVAAVAVTMAADWLDAVAMHLAEQESINEFLKQTIGDTKK